MADETAQVATDPVISDELTTAADMHDAGNEQAADTPVEGVEGEEGAEVGSEISAPASLSSEDKAIFATLPKEAQQWWADTETRRARQVTEATTRAANRERDALTLHKSAEQVAKAQYAQQLAAFVGQYRPQQPDPAQYQDMQAFSRDNAIYQHQMQQYGQIVQQVQAIGADAQQGMAGLTQEQQQREAAQLRDSFPEWFDPEKGPQHVERLTAIGTELGYTPELMAQANASDILALRKGAEWKDKAEKWDKLQSTRMAQVRAGKGSVPPNARGAAVNGQAAPRDTAAAMYPDDVRR